jgi:Tfp pilus assembly protein PilN
VRPVNLIPPEERRGAARVGAEHAPIRIYVVLGVLGVVLLSVLALVLTNNQINAKTEDLSETSAEEQGAKQVADALRPYGQFAQVEQTRKAAVAQLASSRFDWERALQQLSRAIPANVWLLTLTGTASPSVNLEAAGGGEGASQVREKFNAPAFIVAGCTFSQHAVARMMTRMQNLDGVTDVELGKSERKDEAAAAGGAGDAQAAGGQQAEEDASNCVGSERVTQFDMLIVFGGAASALPGAAGTPAGIPTNAAQNAANAQSAVSTANSASAAAGGTGGTP